MVGVDGKMFDDGQEPGDGKDTALEKRSQHGLMMTHEGAQLWFEPLLVLLVLLVQIQRYSHRRPTLLLLATTKIATVLQRPRL